MKGYSPFLQRPKQLCDLYDKEGRAFETHYLLFAMIIVDLTFPNPGKSITEYDENNQQVAK